eukprot:CAMPEP_0115268378 /NCGR_PEP_ID=MMETSP0270-20121206/52490_1 /TAXON_ID=71861 /ORGANISM="Scrippsiella trochoidea, Strain CCMP3099" /LENGTH=91 /DNA_ID=CAMNT_0002684579 /DNA_START=49 /DNA_END=324 /DNA_ORIENTATION=-
MNTHSPRRRVFGSRQAAPRATSTNAKALTMPPQPNNGLRPTRRTRRRPKATPNAFAPDTAIAIESAWCCEVTPTSRSKCWAYSSTAVEAQA